MAKRAKSYLINNFATIFGQTFFLCCGVVSLGLGGFAGASALNGVHSRHISGDLYPYYNHNEFGSIYKFKIQNGELPIIFEDNNELALKCMQYAVDRLDEILQDTKVKLYTSLSAVKCSNYFYVRQMVEEEKSSINLGVTHLDNVSSFSGMMGNRLEIGVDYDKTLRVLNKSLAEVTYNPYTIQFGADNCVLTSVLMHEFLHGLGRCHSENKDPNKTIMLRKINSALGCHYTDFDKYSIQRIYDSKVSTNYNIIPFDLSQYSESHNKKQNIDVTKSETESELEKE